jgi:hypothetical protein
MTTKLDTLQVGTPDEYTLSESYNTFLQSMVGYIRNDPNTRVITIDPEIGYLYKFDLTMFLLTQSVELEDHRLIMMVNGISSRHQFDETTNSLLIPNQALVARLKQIYRTSLAAG